MTTRYRTATPRFQPTPSARRVTFHAEIEKEDTDISTHTLRKEGDRLFDFYAVGCW